MNPYIETINPQINTVIFDIGQVLLSYDWKQYLSTFGYDKETFDRIANAVFLNEDWEKGDAGVVSTSAEWEALFLANAPEDEAAVRAVFAGICHTIAPLPYTDALVARLKEEGYRLYYLSNYSEPLFQDTKHYMGFLEQFDGGVFSFREKCIKPDLKIYRILLERFSICPEKAVFFDDRQNNIEAAQSLRMHGVVFTPDTAYAMLQQHNR